MLRGKAGKDQIYSVGGADVIDAGSDRDQVYIISSAETIKLGGGDDALAFHLGGFYFTADPADRRQLSVDQATLVGRRLDGGDGTDTLDLTETGANPAFANRFIDQGVKIDLSRGRGTELAKGDAGQFRVKNFEVGLGTDRKDTLIASDTGDKLWGWDGEDALRGGAGNDTLLGDFSRGTERDGQNDTLLGGDGLDKLYGGGGDDDIAGGKMRRISWRATTAPTSCPGARARYADRWQWK